MFSSFIERNHNHYQSAIAYLKNNSILRNWFLAIKHRNSKPQDLIRPRLVLQRDNKQGQRNILLLALKLIQ
jgi:hypothetical protein